jgi:hypothetical protein
MRFLLAPKYVGHKLLVFKGLRRGGALDPVSTGVPGPFCSYFLYSVQQF